MHHRRQFYLGLMTLAFTFLLAAALLAQHQEEFSKVVPLSPQGSFSLKNVNGSVTVTTWKEQRVEIKALKKTEKAAENLAKVKIEVEASPDAVAVDTVYPKHENTGVSVNYDVKVPEGIKLDGVSSVNGSVHITGPFAKAAAETVNGEVTIDNASGELNFSTTNGDVKAINIKGKINCETTNGSISLEIDSLPDEIRAETTNGSITLKWNSAQDPNGRLEAETVNGHIELGFPITLQGLQKSKHQLQGQMGQGGPLVSLTTVNGSIRLTK